jgi:hypothetical protein
LAHFVQGLALLIATVAVQAADFSHALHLKLKADCQACHAKAATSSKLEDNLLPEAQACSECHKEVQIKAPRKLRLSKFDHAFHLKMGNVAPVIKGAINGKTYFGEGAALLPHLDTKNACAACHHGIEQSTAIKAEAKAHFPQMPDCLVCHSKIDAPFSCETCHAGDKALKPAFHTPDYLDAHSRKSVKQGCAVCHGRTFTCLGCH